MDRQESFVQIDPIRYGLVGSMGQGGNPYDKPKLASLMKTLKVYESFANVAQDLPRPPSRLTFGPSQSATIREPRPCPRLNPQPDQCLHQGAHSRSGAKFNPNCDLTVDMPFVAEHA
jgi:hypothetical protein